MQKLLSVKNLHVSVGKKTLLSEISFNLASGKVLVIVGQNGAGKSTLARAIAGDEVLKIRQGTIKFLGTDLTKQGLDARARQGIFLSFQDPAEVSGITIHDMLHTVLRKKNKQFSRITFEDELAENLAKLKLPTNFAERELNVDLSGGEKKKNEILQMLMLKPKLVILDEVDSGLDLHATRTISQLLSDFQHHTDAALIVITHNFRILEHLSVDQVLLLESGKILETGDQNLLNHIRTYGFRLQES